MNLEELTVSIKDAIELDRPVTHDRAVPSPPVDPSMLGLPAFVVGSLALGLSLIGVIPTTAGGAILPIVLAATGLGLLLSTGWAMSLGQTAVAAIFGVFTGFWLSYAALLLGLDHGWYAIPKSGVTDTVGAFLLCWTVLIAVLTGATLRLPFTFTLLLGLVVVALALVTVSTYATVTVLATVAGYVVLVFAAVGVYLFLGASSVVLGGTAFGLGRPVQR